MSAKETVFVTCKIVRKTLRAILIDQDGKEVWIPTSQVTHESGDGIECSEWIAEEKELEYDV